MSANPSNDARMPLAGFRRSHAASLGVGTPLTSSLRLRTLLAASLVASTLLAGPAHAADPEDGASESRKGKFDFGAETIFPSGPDDENEYGLFNWILLDVRGEYGISEKSALKLRVPLAPLRPDPPAGSMEEYEIFGGVTAGGELDLGGVLGLGATLGFMRQGAFLLSERDFPRYVGDLKFGGTVGPYLDLQTGVVDLAAAVDLTFQLDSAGEMADETLLALSVPISALVQVGDILKVGLQLGVHTGEGFKLKAASGARIPLVAALSLRLGPVYLDSTVGFASLITGDPPAAYPTIKDSLILGLNVRYAK